MVNKIHGECTVVLRMLYSYDGELLTLNFIHVNIFTKMSIPWSGIGKYKAK